MEAGAWLSATVLESHVRWAVQEFDASTWSMMGIGRRCQAKGIMDGCKTGIPAVSPVWKHMGMCI